MKVIVDNSEGADQRFAAEVAERLAGEGVSVELREPAPAAMFDTGIHLVSAGIAIRLSSAPEAAELSVIERVVRDVLMHRPSLRRRMRAVPVHIGESARTVAWIDVFE